VIKDDVAYIMSMPRLAFTDNMYSLITTVGKLGLYGQRHSGVFWEQSLERLFESTIEKGYKYALTIDYDTFYNEYNILDLYNIMGEHPEIGVLAPLQARRGNTYPMAGVFNDEDGDSITIKASRVFINGIAEMETAHFGLTLVRLSEFQKLSKPWFISVPDSKGSWGLGHKDADVNFWIKCKKEGIKVALAEVWIGHLELLCSWCGPQETNFTTQRMEMNDILSGGVPYWAIPKSYEGSDNLYLERKDMSTSEKLKEKEEQLKTAVGQIQKMQAQLAQAQEVKLKLIGAVAALREVAEEEKAKPEEKEDKGSDNGEPSS